jgi:hypothetical protein
VGGAAFLSPNEVAKKQHLGEIFFEVCVTDGYIGLLIQDF